MKFTKKKLALAIGGALITMSVLVSGCSTGSDKKADTIKIGVVAELTGNNATYGTSITNGIKLAVQQLNDTGGLLGKKIELVVADNKSEPAEAANAMSKLVNQDKAPVVMGLFASSSELYFMMNASKLTNFTRKTRSNRKIFRQQTRSVWTAKKVCINLLCKQCGITKIKTMSTL